MTLGDKGFEYPSFMHKLSFVSQSNMKCISGNACEAITEIKSIECTNNEADNVLPDWYCYPKLKYDKYNDLKLTDARPLCVELNLTDTVYPHMSYGCTISFTLTHDANIGKINNTFDKTFNIFGIFENFLCILLFILLCIVLIYACIAFIVYICYHCRQWYTEQNRHDGTDSSVANSRREYELNMVRTERVPHFHNYHSIPTMEPPNNSQNSTMDV